MSRTFYDHHRYNNLNYRGLQTRTQQPNPATSTRLNELVKKLIRKLTGTRRCHIILQICPIDGTFTENQYGVVL